MFLNLIINSVDAFAFGAKLGPEDALRFARGTEVTATGGLKAKLDRPLDFLVIADHSGGLGATQALYDAPRLFIRDPTLLRWHDTMHEGPAGRLKVTAELIDVGAGADADFAKVDVTGRVVFTTGNARQVFPRAMQKGARGVLATQKLPEYNQQSKNARAIQFTGIQRDSIRNGWLLWVSRQSADSLRSALSAGPVLVTALVKTLFETRPERTLVADVRGRTTNGGVNVQLNGNTWKGVGLNVETTNGGVNLSGVARW
jgi:hypothetical protein